MRRNKLIFAGEKKVASHSPAGVVLSNVETAHKRVWARTSARCWGFGVTLAGPRNPHAVATEPRATAAAPSFMGEREREKRCGGEKGEKRKKTRRVPVGDGFLHANPALGGGGLGGSALAARARDQHQQHLHRSGQHGVAG